MLLRRSPSWYVRRMRRFQRGELRWRATNTIGEQVWRHRWSRRATLPSSLVCADRAFTATLPPTVVDAAAAARTSAAADEILRGDWYVLGVERHDLVAPDWSADGFLERPYDLDGRPMRQSAKHVWELSRGHVLTVLAAAYRITNEERYAQRCAALLSSWWTSFPSPLDGQWASVEVAERLISWVWVRRLLDPWPGSADLFERNPVALRQLYLHQDLLGRFPSRFSSANNHRIAEAAGLLTAACAFPWFRASTAWRGESLRIVQDELDIQLHRCGLQREPAVDYHCFVLDLAFVSLAEAARARVGLRPATIAALERMGDALAAVVDEQLRPPRHGDSDESQVAQLDGPWTTPAVRSLSLAEACVGATTAWPPVPRTTRADFVAALAGTALATQPPGAALRPSTTTTETVARDAGLVVLRRAGAWVSLRAGAFAYLPIGSHSHADLLAIELRLGGAPVFVDPGTYVYDALPEWRRWLRSTAAHNTLCVDQSDQAEYWGPFLWGSDATATVDELRVEGADIVRCRAHHEGYARLAAPTIHERTVELDARSLEITDRLRRDGAAAALVSMTYLFAPAVVPIQKSDDECRFTCELVDQTVEIKLPEELRWLTQHASPTGPGWHSEHFASARPTWALVGTGPVRRDMVLRTIVSW